MAEPVRRRATYEDLLRLPEGVHAEIVDGEIYTFPSGLPRHGLAAAGLLGFVGWPYGFDPAGPGGWWFVVETDVEFSPHDVVRPDLAGWRRSHVPTFPEERPIRIVPDWICEVLSPSTARHDLVPKAALYARHAVPFYWIVDPAARVLEAFRWHESQWLRLGAWSDRDRVRIAPFEAVEIEIGRLFPPPRPDEILEPTSLEALAAAAGAAP
jgi:Uma2 family endonuclease